MSNLHKIIGPYINSGSSLKIYKQNLFAKEQITKEKDGAESRACVHTQNI